MHVYMNMYARRLNTGRSKIQATKENIKVAVFQSSFRLEFVALPRIP